MAAAGVVSPGAVPPTAAAQANTKGRLNVTSILPNKIPEYMALVLLPREGDWVGEVAGGGLYTHVHPRNQLEMARCGLLPAAQMQSTPRRTIATLVILQLNCGLTDCTCTIRVY